MYNASEVSHCVFIHMTVSAHTHGCAVCSTIHLMLRPVIALLWTVHSDNATRTSAPHGMQEAVAAWQDAHDAAIQRA